VAATAGEPAAAPAPGKRPLPASFQAPGAAAAARSPKRAAGAGGSVGGLPLLTATGATAGDGPSSAGGGPGDLRWDKPRTDVQSAALASALEAAMQRKRAERFAGAASAGNLDQNANHAPNGGLLPGRAPAPWLRAGFDAQADAGRRGRGDGAGAESAGSYGSAFGAPVRSPYEGIARVAGAAAQQLYTAATGERRLPPSLQAAGQVILNGLGMSGTSGGGGGGRPPAHPTQTEADAQVWVPFCRTCFFIMS